MKSERTKTWARVGAVALGAVVLSAGASVASAAQPGSASASPCRTTVGQGHWDGVHYIASTEDEVVTLRIGDRYAFNNPTSSMVSQADTEYAVDWFGQSVPSTDLVTTVPVIDSAIPHFYDQYIAKSPGTIHLTRSVYNSRNNQIDDEKVVSVTIRILPAFQSNLG